MLSVKIESDKATDVFECLEVKEKKVSGAVEAIAYKKSVKGGDPPKVTDEWFIYKPKDKSNIYVMNDKGSTLSKIHADGGGSGISESVRAKAYSVVLIPEGEAFFCDKCGVLIAKAKCNLTNFNLREKSVYEFATAGPGYCKPIDHGKSLRDQTYNLFLSDEEYLERYWLD